MSDPTVFAIMGIAGSCDGNVVENCISASGSSDGPVSVFGEIARTCRSDPNVVGVDDGPVADDPISTFST